ncbi:MAG: pitrilysin family protein [Candidatus Omnitrophota bacterium]
MKQKIYFFLLLIIIVYSVVAPANAAGIDNRSELSKNSIKIEKFKLKNGLTVLIQENHNSKLAAFEMLVKTGSLSEGQKQGSGIAHLIEHMLFKGTPTRPQGKIEDEVRSLGGSINGYTAHQFTGFPLVVPSDKIDHGLNLLRDMIFNPQFDPEELQKEKGVILSEIRLNQDDPQRYLNRTFWETIYATAPYNFPVIGLEILFVKLKQEDLLEFHRKWYIPNNMIISISGDVNTYLTLEKVKNMFGNLEMQDFPQLLLDKTPEFRSQTELAEPFDVNVSYLMIGFPSVKTNHQDAACLDIIASILGQGQSSRLHKSLVEDKKLAYSIEAYNYTPEFPGFFAVSCLFDYENREIIKENIFSQLEFLERDKGLETEIEKAKNSYFSEYLFSQKTVQSQAQTAAHDEAYSQDPYFSQKYLKRISRVSAQDVRRCVRDYFQPEKVVSIILFPKDIVLEKEIEKMQSTEPIKKIMLDNGLTVLLKKNPASATVSLHAVFGGGVRREDETNNGLFNLLSKMLIRGTKHYNGKRIAEEIEYIGGDVSVFSGYNSFGLNLEILSKDIDQGLDFFTEMVRNSVFPDKEFQVEKHLALKNIEIQNDEIFQDTFNRLKETLFVFLPYHFTKVGKKTSVDAITREQLLSYYRKFCVPNNTVISVFGDIDPEKIEILLKKNFSNWKPGQIEKQVYPDLLPQEKQRIVRNERDKKQAVVMIGFPGVQLHNRERFGLLFLSRVLSAPGSVLYQRIRDELGLAYSLGGDVVSGLDGGYFYIYVATTPANTEQVTKIVFEEIEKIKKQMLSDQVIETTKSDLIGQHRLQREADSELSFICSLEELFGLGYDYYNKIEEEIKILDAQTLNLLANKYLNIDKSVVVVTKSEF